MLLLRNGKSRISWRRAACSRPGALRRSAWKKRLARFAFQDRVFARSHCLQAKSEAEYRDIRLFGLHKPVALIPNAIGDPVDVGDPERSAFRERHGIPQDKRILLYLGRLHPVKGLERLLTAWASLSSFHSEWQLVLAGPDEDGYQSVLTALVGQFVLGRTVTFTGSLHGREKWATYATAELFVMASDFENFGSAIAEALACGLPVVTTTGTPWMALRDTGCGWWVEPSAPALAAALTEAMSLPEGRRRKLGERAALFGRRVPVPSRRLADPGRLRMVAWPVGALRPASGWIE